MESALHRLAVALGREGISDHGPIPAAAVARLCAELGISPKSLRNRRWELKTASEAGREKSQGPVSVKASRYRSDPIYAASMREQARQDRLRDYPYHVFKNTRGNARKRGLPFELTREQVAEMLAPMTCSATGLRLLPKWEGPGRNPWWPSLDQLDPCAGYRPGNVRAVCWAYNVMKGELTDQEARFFAAALLRGAVRDDEAAGRVMLASRFGANKTTAVAHYMGRWRGSAKERSLHFDLPSSWAEKRLARGVCEATGLALSTSYSGPAHRNPLVPSLDRIDCARGYEPDNVRLVCGWFNYARQDWPDEIVRKVARALLRRSARTG